MALQNADSERAAEPDARAILTVVGLGPGDPELITLKGLRALQSATHIFVPRSRDGDSSMALRIAAPWIDAPRQQVVELPLPMTRDADQLAAAWRQAAATIAAHLDSPDARGAYLLLGDPLLYGTFTYLASELVAIQAPIDITIIPGITSFAAAAALGQLPLGTTNDRLAILPASYETDGAALRRLLTDFETVVLMKVGGVLPQIIEALDELGMLDNALYAERVGMPEEYVVRDLRALQGQRRPYLSLLIVRRGLS